MTTHTIYEARYDQGWALVIGINEYAHAAPLEYACNDATAVAAALNRDFDFPEEKTFLLLNEEGNKENILSHFARFTSNEIGENDRVFVFFAGHGCTKRGSRGEVGFLVPQDGAPDDISTLVAWADLIKQSELIIAKHMLFVMDSCYGGTALQRYLPPGAKRFAKDMLRRFSRQVLTAGKADELVADAGGPRAGHSVFTGHLLDGLAGRASSTDGLITANTLMSYVYDKVAKDYESQQTPHYGFLDGDGDMVLNVSHLGQMNNTSGTDTDMLVSIPANLAAPYENADTQTLPEEIKEYLSDERYRIKLHDMVVREIRRTLAEINAERFPVESGSITHEEAQERLRRYEAAVSRLSTIVGLLARWGTRGHRDILKMVFERMRDVHVQGSGLVVLFCLQWYPMSFLSYVGGVASVAADEYENLAAILFAPVKDRLQQAQRPLVSATVEAMVELDQSDVFKAIPGHDRFFVPRSEYMFKAVQPIMEDLFFLGDGYERHFDRFELLLALSHADYQEAEGRGLWGPPGRFGWKRVRSDDPFTALVAEAAGQRDDWGPLQAGFFGSSYTRFEEVASGYRELLGGLRWY